MESFRYNLFVWKLFEENCIFILMIVFSFKEMLWLKKLIAPMEIIYWEQHHLLLFVRIPVTAK